jgi:amphi-Trp domain-containing protein
MTSPSKEKVSIARIEAVQRLQTLARQIETGTVRLGETLYKVPEQVRLEVKGERGELEIELKWKEEKKAAV